jgi:hypothetical protein
MIELPGVINIAEQINDTIFRQKVVKGTAEPGIASRENCEGQSVWRTGGSHAIPFADASLRHLQHDNPSVIKSEVRLIE